jgi:spore germination protein YaaH
MRRFAILVLLAGVAGPASAYKLSAWIPTWDPAALETMQRNAGSLDESNPSWYTLTAQGEIAKNWNAEAPELRAALTGTRLVPTIKNYVDGSFNADVMTALLSTAASRERHAEAIAQLSVTQALDGIDIDYEAMRSSDREPFSLFVEVLSAKLHAIGKTLSVTVHAKTSDAATWDGPGAQDWARLGAAADAIKIMAYDKHWATSAPGAIAPLDWLGNVAAYALTRIAPEKVIVALPWYGYDWGAAGGTGVTWTQATELARAKGATITRDANGEATFSYGANVVYFQDGESYKRKVDALIARFPMLGGFAHWRAGGEDPAIWDSIAALVAQSGTRTFTPGVCTVESPKTLDVRAGQQSVAPVSVSGFDSAVAASVEMIDRFDGSVLLSANQLEVGKTAKLIVAAAPTAAAGTYRVRLRFAAPANAVQQDIQVQVVAGGRGRVARR